MHSLYHELQSKIRYKIILPFLVLTLLVALAGSTVALGLTAESQQERLRNRVAEVTRTTNDSIVDQERINLEQLRQMVFAPANAETGAPAVATALQNRNAAGLRLALTPYFEAGIRNPAMLFDRVIAFDRDGNTLFDLERDLAPPGEPADLIRTYQVHRPFKFIDAFVDVVLQGQRDGGGDKYAALIQITPTLQIDTHYFATIAPVYEDPNAATGVVGGIIVATRAANLLETLAARSNADVIIIYDFAGRALYSTRRPNPLVGGAPTSSLEALNIDPTTLGNLQESETRSVISTVLLPEGDVSINERRYQLGFTPLLIRQNVAGFIAAGLSVDYIGSLTDIRGPIAVLTILFMLGIVGLGLRIARQITTPLEELVVTTRDVTAGNLRRRSQVATDDELGELARSFNIMTGYLFHLYSRVLAEAGQRAAIVDSIADGVVVCDTQGTILVINRATRRLLNLAEDAPHPTHFRDLPLEHLTEGKGAFGPEHSASLYTIGNAIVRLSEAPVITSAGSYVGDVYVLYDLTAEVNIDRAKTNFIGTISHELRTPLTPMQINADMLLRGSFGALEERQASAIETMRHKIVHMSELINNTIAIADIDSGSLEFELELLDLEETIEEALSNAKGLRKNIADKGLTLTLDIPKDLPQVSADYFHLQTILHHLVNNARLYTEQGGITIRASHQDAYVQIDVVDTGCGIPPDMHERIFQRFERGTGKGQGIDSQERGIGLGLAIVKYLVENQRGRIWVTSEVGRGSTFSFTLRHNNDLAGTEDQGTTAFGTAA